MLGSSIEIGGPNRLAATGVVDLLDDVLFTAGDDSDIAYLLKSGTLNANTALTGVLLGTPVSQALAANSFLLSNVTANGDIALYGNLGGNSQQFLMYDTSATALTLGVASGYTNLLGNVFIGDTSNANVTKGLTINQAANIDSILSFKQSGVAHGLTTYAETDTYNTWAPLDGADGGLRQRAFKENVASNVVMKLEAFGGQADTTKSTAGRSLIEYYMAQHDGSNALVSIAATGNIFGIRPYVGGADTTVFIFGGNGATWQNGPASISDSVQLGNTTEGGTARLNVRTIQQAVTLTGATTDTTFNIPTGSILLGASFCVNTAVVDSAGDDTWSAAYVTGATTALATAAAAAQNTKVNTLIAPEKASNTTNIRFTPNGGNFSSGVIEVVAYYIDLTSLASV